jgi:hypothetical protein
MLDIADSKRASETAIVESNFSSVRYCGSFIV